MSIDLEITTEPRHWPVGLSEYHRDLMADSNSSLGLFVRDRWGYYLQRICGFPGPRGSHATDLGTAFHTFFQEPEKFDSDIIVLPDGVTRKQKKGETVLLDNPHTPVIEQADIYKLERMKAAVEASVPCMELIEQDGWDIEHAVGMIHEPSGLPIKVCYDGLHATGRIRDIKTAANPRLTGYHNFRDCMWDYGYYRQAALYCYVRDAYRPFFSFEPNDDGMIDCGYDWIVVGTDEPFKAYRYSLGAATKELGDFHNDAILKTLAACKLFAGDSDEPGPWQDSGHGKTVIVDVRDYCFRKELEL